MEQNRKWPNRRSYDSGGLIGIFRRTLRVVPTFAMCALVSCAFWYQVYHVSAERLSVVAAVPCVMGFVMMQILALTLPSDAKESELTHTPPFFQTFVVLSVSSAFISVDLLLSAAVYYAIGFQDIVVEALKVTRISGLCAFGLIIVALVTRLSGLGAALLKAALRLLRAQTKITNAFFGAFSHEHSPR